MGRPDKYQKSVGKCPYCNKFPKWFNNVPLMAYCWGPENKEHKEWTKVVPRPLQPY